METILQVRCLLSLLREAWDLGCRSPSLMASGHLVGKWIAPESRLSPLAGGIELAESRAECLTDFAPYAERPQRVWDWHIVDWE